MADKVKIGDRSVGKGERCLVIAEVGINHNGDIDIAKKLISGAMVAGCEMVKFQKRTIDVVYTAEELAKPRETPFGETNGDLKRGLEFGKDQYDQIDAYCKQHKLMWIASAWDEGAMDFIEQYDPPCWKIASASITDDHLLKHHRATGRPIIISTGMSTIEQIDHAVEVLGTNDLIILHCTSTYPSKVEELNLACIETLRERYQVPIGYSGHEVGLACSVAAATLGACIVERHITLDRAMWGSDQAASVEPHGVARLVKEIRAIESATGDGQKIVYDSEKPIVAKLRRVGQ